MFKLKFSLFVLPLFIISHNATARFLSEDPEGFKAGVNFYVYCGNNPVNCSDPNGKAPVYNGTDQPIVVGGGSGAGSGHGPDSVYVQMPLAPGQVVDANHPLIDANGNQLTDVDAVDFNGDGIAQQPTSNMSYLTGEKVPGTDQGVITPTDNLRINVYNILGISVPVIVPNTPIQTPTQSPTSSVDEETSSAAADGGFVLYPNMSNTNQMRSVYSKH